MYRISRPNKRGKIFDKKYKRLMQESNISSEHMLQYLQENGIINIDDVENAMKKSELERILKQHPYKITFSAGRWQTFVKDDTQKSGRKKLAKSTEEKLNIALYEYYKKQEQQLSHVTLKTLYPEWIEYKALHTTASNYIRRINNDWDKYYKDSDIINKQIKQLDKLTLDMWAHKLIQHYHMSKTQYYNCTIIMRQALDYAVDLGIITENPFSLVQIDGRRLFRQVKKKPDQTQVYFENELKLLSDMAWDDFHSNDKLRYRLAPLAVLFQFQTGVRLGELCALRFSDVKGDYINIERMYRYETKEVVNHTKGFEDRRVLLTKKAKEILDTARSYQTQQGFSINGYIFSLGNNPLSEAAISNLYKKYCDKIGIVHKSSHKSRKTYISSLIDGQININTIREMVGHADERTTYSSYCFDRHTEQEKRMQIEQALA